MDGVEILEVAPRDGFQAVKAFIPTDAKIAVIEDLAACGFKRLEIGSFVGPKALPQMADTPDILKKARLPESLHGCSATRLRKRTRGPLAKTLAWRGNST